jgi:PAS domain S-box-containing protein
MDGAPGGLMHMAPARSMNQLRDHPISRYGCALVSVALAFWVRLRLDPVFGDRLPIATFFLAVLVSAWYGGFLPALVAVAVGAVASDYFMSEPRGTFAFGFDQKLGLALYLVTAIGIALLAGLMHAARRRAESAARSSVHQAALIDLTHDAVLVWDWNGPITFWNQGAERLYKFSRLEAIGRVSHDLLSTNTEGGVARFIDVLEREGSWEGELHHVTRDARALVVESRMVLVRHPDRSYVLETNRDITARKEAEATLRTANRLLETRVRERTAELAEINHSLHASEERYRLLVDGVHEYAIFMLDSAAKVETWNAGAQRSKGYEAAEIIGRHFSHLYLEDDIARGMPEQDLQIAASTGRCEREGWRGRKDGSRFFARTVITALPGQGKELRGYAVLTRDITEAKRAEVMLQDSEARFRSYIENAPVAVLVTNHAGRFVDCNPAAVAMLGYSAAELIGLPILAVSFDEDQEAVRRDLDILASVGSMEGEYRMRRKDGSVLWASVRAATLKEGGSLAHCVDITSRRQSEAALRAERDWFARIVATVPVVICSFLRRPDGSACFPFANPRLEHIYGVPPQELARDASSIFSRIHPDDAESFRAGIEASARALSIWRTEFRVRNPSRGEIWVEGHAVPTLEDNGDVLWQGYIADITEKRKTEEALRASETSFRLLLEGVVDHAIYMLDPAGNVQTWNKGAERIDGYTAGEIIGRHFSCLFTPEAIAAGKPQQELEHAATQGKADVDGWRVRKNGSRFWANGTVAALYDHQHRVRGFAKVTRDLTAKRRNDELLRSVLDNTLDAIIGIDEQGTISMINHAGERIFGQTEAEVIGNNVKMLMPTPYHGEHDSYLKNYLQGGQAKIIGIGREVRGLRKDGSTFPMDLAVTEFRLDNQRYFVGIVRDISERKRLETQLHQSQKMEAFGQLAGGVAHDFNNLLTVISGYSDLLLNVLPPDDANRVMINEIRIAGERATSLTRQLLAFTRQQVLEPRVIDLNGVVKGIETMLRRLIGEDIQLASVLRGGISSVKVDPGQIEQVITNLAINARDAMPRGGRLTIETNDTELLEDYVREHSDTRPGRVVMLAISDNGCGMSPELKARIFEPFFTTKGGRGTGLGLAVVQGIVKQSGGSIEVYSEVGVGTTFKIYLPAVSGQHTVSLDPDAEGSPRGDETILLVEDEGGVRQLAVAALEGFGYRVLTSAGGSDAVQLMASHRGHVHLLVTDVVMPGMSGRKLAEILQANYPGMKVLFLSGYTDDAVVRHGVLQAHVAFLQKPFTPISLARKVREVLDRD